MRTHVPYCPTRYRAPRCVKAVYVSLFFYPKALIPKCKSLIHFFNVPVAFMVWLYCSHVVHEHTLCLGILYLMFFPALCVLPLSIGFDHNFDLIL